VPFKAQQDGDKLIIDSSNYARTDILIDLGAAIGAEKYQAAASVFAGFKISFVKNYRCCESSASTRVNCNFASAG
jgi:hypothetical protein